jgi:hypothetical protein
MRVGVRLGPFWVSSGGHRRRGGIGVFGAWFIFSLLCGNWFGTTVSDWMLWIGIPALIVLGVIARHQTRRERRPAPAPSAPRNPRMYHSDRR